MKNLSLIIAILFSTFSLAQNVEWKTLEEAEQIIKKNPEKQILLYYYTDWCGYCRKMEKETFGSEEAATFINQNFIPVRFNGENKENVKFLGYNYSYIPKARVNMFSFFFLQGQMAYPGTVIIDKDSKILNSVLGYVDTQNYISMLNIPTKKSQPQLLTKQVVVD